MLKSLPFSSQIKTKHRYVWTKRESTNEGSTLGELVDQVSLLTLQMSGTDVFFFSFLSVLFYSKEILCVSYEIILIISWTFSVVLSLRFTNFPAEKTSSRL